MLRLKMGKTYLELPTRLFLTRSILLHGYEELRWSVSSLQLGTFHLLGKFYDEFSRTIRTLLFYFLNE